MEPDSSIMRMIQSGELPPARAKSCLLTICLYSVGGVDAELFFCEMTYSGT